MKTPLRPLLFLVSFNLGLVADGDGAPAAPPPPDGPVVLLPEVSVSTKFELRAEDTWLTGRLGNFVIYSRASEKRTREFVTQFYRFHQAFTHLFPKTDIAAKSTVTLVLCENTYDFAALAPKNFSNVSTSVGDAYNTYLLIDLGVYLRGNEPGSFEKSRSGPDGAMSGANDVTLLGEEAAQRQFDLIDGETLLRREYIHLLFRNGRNRPPLWVEEALAMYFSSMEIRKNEIRYARIDRDIVRWFDPNLVRSLPAFFAVTPDSPAYNIHFSRYAMVFLHYGMFAGKMRHQKAFLEFIGLPAEKQADEAVFKKHFGMGFAKMEACLKTYIGDGGAFRAVVAPKPVSFPPEPAYALRKTADAENGRLKGDILRLNRRHADANAEMLSPVLRRTADARLLARLGLLKYEMQDFRSAGEYLGRAVAEQVDDPAAYVTLARMRLDLALKDAAPQAGLGAAPLSAVLKPLYTAHKLGVDHPELYGLIAEAWEHARTEPTADALAVLDEGIRLYPSNADYVYRAAALKIRGKRYDDARLLIEGALKAARDEPTRARFERLKAALPAAAGTTG